MTIKNDTKAVQLLDELLKDYKGPEDALGESGLLKQFTQALVERALEAELTHHLGYAKHDPAGRLTEKWLPNGVNTRYAYTPRQHPCPMGVRTVCGEGGCTGMEIAAGAGFLILVFT